MERNIQIASHAGVVTGVKEGLVAVQIESTSACASCAAHAKCGFAESKNKTVEIPTEDWRDYKQGDTVEVKIDESRGMLAVWIAYVLPALLLIVDIVDLSVAGLPEWAVVLSSFAVLGVYVAILYASRRKVEGRFTLTVNKQ